MKGKTPLIFATAENIIGIVAVKDSIKPTSKQAVSMLNSMGIDVIMLTGDNNKTAQIIKDEVGINTVISDLLPQQKQEIVSDLIERGKKVAMVGDGINDSPALALADVGIAIGAGTDIAIDSADAVLMKSDLLDVPYAIELSNATIKNIRQNLFWALFYNVLGIPLAAGVLYISFELKLNPMFAAGAMSLSSLFVVSNALRLRFFKPHIKGFEDSIIKPNYQHLNPILDVVIEEKGDFKMIKLIRIDGMACGHCSGAVTAALNGLEGVTAEVDLQKAQAEVTMQREISDEILTKIITDKGYTVVSISKVG